jgi:hypothetical protein
MAPFRVVAPRPAVEIYERSPLSLFPVKVLVWPLYVPGASTVPFSKLPSFFSTFPIRLELALKLLWEVLGYSH